MTTLDGELWRPQAKRDMTPKEAEEVNRQALRDSYPAIDWATAWAEPLEKDWIIPSLLAAGGHIAIYSPAKTGKSLLVLELSAALATGRTVLGQTPKRAYRVSYVDYENDLAEIMRRLRDMGYGPADDLSNLEIITYAGLRNLDTAAGGKELIDRLVKVHRTEIVVIDTMSRAVQGKENDNDTWNDFSKHTGIGLKRLGIAMIRLDHSGKDESKGQRGGSAKNSDVDAVWRLSVVTPEKTYRLACDMSRMEVPDRVLTLHREAGPLRHRLDGPGDRYTDAGRLSATEARVQEIIDVLDDNDLPKTTGRPTAGAALRDLGIKFREDYLAEAVRRRKGRPNLVGTPPGNLAVPGTGQ